jgi:hypothetical protein
MRIKTFLKLSVLFVCAALVIFASTEVTVLSLLKMVAAGLVLSVAVSVVYPEIRGIKRGDTVAVVSGNSIHTLLGRLGVALDGGRKNTRIKVKLDNGDEILGIVESYDGIVSPPRIKVVYEERLVE